MANFKLHLPFQPAGDQPQAIKAIEKGLEKGMRQQTLFGVTGSGKTFTIANVIAKHDKPTLVLAHNKTLAAQLALKSIEKFSPGTRCTTSSPTMTTISRRRISRIQIPILRRSDDKRRDRPLAPCRDAGLLTRKDVIIVASVSAIYGLGSPEEYEKVYVKIKKEVKKIARRSFGNSSAFISSERMPT